MSSLVPGCVTAPGIVTGTTPSLPGPGSGHASPARPRERRWRRGAGTALTERQRFHGIGALQLLPGQMRSLTLLSHSLMNSVLINARRGGPHHFCTGQESSSGAVPSYSVCTEEPGIHLPAGGMPGAPTPAAHERFLPLRGISESGEVLPSTSQGAICPGLHSHSSGSSPFDPESFSLEVPPPREAPPPVSLVPLLSLLYYTCDSGAATGTRQEMCPKADKWVCVLLEQRREHEGMRKSAAGGKFGAFPSCRDVTAILPGVM
ncbi:uncharacterized protein LOC120763665 [Hirundo rustica]|uniref:uncharacterized protein LOC120763665 n=1 Tax=Hirundo rustica TaxID=43150 RepID=UPI001A946AA1|nr:uncharacterized protein LOC120763665 [Hirundo rustica]